LYLPKNLHFLYTKIKLPHLIISFLGFRGGGGGGSIARPFGPEWGAQTDTSRNFIQEILVPTAVAQTACVV
jgi:hypothetical protein